MLTLFHGTARPNSNSEKIATIYDELLWEMNIPHQFFTLQNAPETIFNKTFHAPKHPDLAEIERRILIPTSKYIFIISNGDVMVFRPNTLTSSSQSEL